MFLKSPDPDAFAVIAGDRRYPVRDGVFLINPDDRASFPGVFEAAGDVSPEVAAELAELGSYPLEASGSADAPAAAEEESSADDSDAEAEQSEDAAAEDGSESSEEEDEPHDVDLSSLTVAQLEEYAAEHGIELPNGNKAAKLAAIQAAQN